MTGFDASGFAGVLPWTALAVVALMIITFGAAHVVGRVAVVDVTWALLFVAVGWVSFALGTGDPLRRWLLAVLVTVWGLRLAVSRARAQAGKGEDPRYTALLGESSHRTRTAIEKVYAPQAILAWIISAPLQVGAFERPGVGVLGWLGVAVWAVGLYFESVGDAQLSAYRRWKSKQPKEEVRASVMDKGLWRYTRHPNYFGDAAVWTGLFLLAAERWPGVLTVPATAIMIYLLVFGSGKKNTEKTMAKRPGYPEYMRRTSGFLPWPAKDEPAGPPTRQPTTADLSLIHRRAS